MKYTPVIGLEIHAELKTASKMFCSCKNDPDEEKPNANVCPICLGHPGTLPVLNRQAITHVLRVGAAVNGTPADFTEWDRKNYFYPDIPKGYQLSQYKYPLVSGGELAGVALERVHLEEDTARSTHDQHEKSMVDFDRSGVPLMELVTKPVIRDAATAVAFAKELQLLLRCLGAGDANMEKGELRVEANVSVSSPADAAAGKFGTKTEVKNLNSFKSVEHAIAYEIERQTRSLEAGEKVIQETRGWDDAAHETYSQRSKESSHDYRYFPDPDIPKMKISEIPEFSLTNLKKDLPELPWAKRDRFKKDFGMTDKEVAMFVESSAAADYFEHVVEPFKKDAKKIRLAINYIVNDYLGPVSMARILTDSARHASRGEQANIELIPHVLFSELIQMIVSNEISSRGAKDLINLLLHEENGSNSEPVSIKRLAEKHGLLQKSDAALISPMIDKVIADNAKAVAEYRAGKTASLQFLIGAAMKAAKGSANPEVVKKLLIEKLG